MAKGRIVWEVESRRVSIEDDGRFWAEVRRPCACPECPTKEHWLYLGGHFTREAAIVEANRY